MAPSDLEGQRVWAEQRKAYMKELIMTDPERALEEALSPRERAALPPEIANEIEQVVAGRGFYGVLALCSHGAGGHQGCKIRREVMLDGNVYQAHIYGKRLDQTTQESDSLYGIAVDDQLALHEDSLVRVEAAEQLHDLEAGQVAALHDGELQIFDSVEELEEFEQALVAAALEFPGLEDPQAGIIFDPSNPPTGPAFPTDVYDRYTGRNSHQLGPKTLMVMVVRPSDGDSYGASPPNFAALDSDMDNTSQWYYNESYKQTWFGPKEDSFGVVDRLVVTVELNLPRTVAEYRAQGGFSLLQSDAKAAVQAQGGDWTNNGPKDPDRFDRWVVMSKSKLISSTGLAFVGGKFSWVGGSLDGGVAYHELGHNWGVYHANYWQGDNGIPRNASGSHTEYGDGADIMGGGGSFNPLFKEKLGFLYAPDGDIIEVTSNGNYRIFDHTEAEADKAVTRARALKVPITGTSTSSKFLMFGLRHSGGSDGALGRSSWNRNALELHSDQVSSVTGDNDGSHFLDTSPGSRANSSDDKADGALLIGRTYSEPADLNGNSLYGEVHVTPVARGSLEDNGIIHEYMDVVVNVGDYSTNQAPTALFTASASDVGTGVDVTFSSTSNDPEGDPLALSWTFGDDRYSYDNDVSQTVSWSTPGLYEVILTVTDMKGGTDSSSMWINVGGIPYQDPANPSATLAGLSYRYYESPFSSVPNFDTLRPVKTGTVSTFSISPRDQNDNFAFLFEGFINIPATEVYTFYLDSEDGSQLYIGDTLVVDNDHNSNSNQESQGNIALNAGVHRIRVEFFHATRSEKLEVDWKSSTATGGLRSPLAASFLLQQDWTGNDAPQVSVTSPDEAAQIVVGNDVTLTAAATDADGIDRVLFFSGSSYLGEDDTAPYSYTWLAPPTGTQEVVAIAYDSTGRWTESALRSFEVTPPEVRRQIGLNLGGDKQALAAGDVAGAIYAAPNWNNLNGERQSTPQSVIDSDGLTSGAVVTWESRSQNPPRNTLGDTSTPNGRMMYGLNVTRKDFPSQYPRVEVEQIPYMEYDVYVYFDNNRSQSNDRNLIEFDLDGEKRYGRNSASNADTSDTIGDYPNYDTWTGFREATATDQSDPLDAQLGNYVVFRAQMDPAFRLEAIGNNTGNTYQPVLNAVQIVEAPPSTARVHVQESDWSSEVSEAGGTDTYTVQLTLPPDNGATITVDILPDAQVMASPSQLSFDATNYDSPQTVTLSAVDDSDKEDPTHMGSVSHSIQSSVSSNYSGALATDLTVAVLDDDKPTLTLSVQSSAAEAGPTPGSFRITRSGISSLLASETVNFTVTGSATAATDYLLLGASSFDSASGQGSAVIASGQSSLDLTILPLDDADKEGPETIRLQLSADPSEYLLGTGDVTMTLTDDEILLSENFETFSAVGAGNSWTNGSGDFSWSVDSGGTPSSGTGPRVDKTLGTSVGTYLFTESSSPNFPDKRADLETPTVNMSGLSSATLSFWYHMYGSAMGTLHIDVFSGGSWTLSVSSLNGQQQSAQDDAWLEHSVDLRDYMDDDTRVRFRLVTSSSFTSDAAIDDVEIVGFSSSAAVAPSILAQPQGQTLIEGDTLVLSVTATGSPTPTYQWRLDNVDIPGATSPSYSLPSATTGNAGSYTVRVSNSEGSVTSQAAIVQVDTATPPTFTQQPSSATVNEGGQLVLTVAADGYPAPEYQWRRNGVNLSNASGLSGVNSSSLTLNPADLSMSGSYDVVASNSGGSATSTAAQVTVNSAPQITLNSPKVPSVLLPSGVGLILESTVTDDGVGTLTTQWSKVSGPGNVIWDHQDQQDTGLRFDADGDYELRLTASDGALQSTLDVMVTVGASGGGASGFQESGGLVVIEAEHYQSMQVGSGAFAASTWTATTAASGYSGASAMELPNTGNSLNSRDVTEGPRMDYPVSFSTTGTYRVWVRILGASGNDDSVHAGIDGSLLSGGGVGMSDSSGSWSWVNSANAVVSFQVNSPGERILNIWPREDGVLIDKIVLTTDTQFSPSGQGPAESAQGAGNVGALVDAGSLSDGVVSVASMLSASSSDDGLPSMPGAVTLLWQQMSGPGTLNFGDASQQDSSVSADLAGSYELRLIADDGELKSFDQLSWTVADVSSPAAPGNLVATSINATRIDLSWVDPSASENGFRIERAPAASGPWNLLQDVAADSVSFSDTGLAAGVFHYRVRSLGSSGNSAPSAPASASTLDTDNDGMLDDHELVAGTSPTDNGDLLKIRMSSSATEDLGLEVDTVLGVYYRVTYRESLTAGDWAVLPGYENYAGDGSPFTVEDSFTGSRFYRIEVRNSPWL